LVKYVLCRENSLADMITNTRALENVQGVESVTISLNREVLVSTDLRHSLIRVEITKPKKKQMNYAAPIEVPNKEKSSTMSID
jgi:copper chaperone CopZ